jgi:hypothetical protein
MDMKEYMNLPNWKGGVWCPHIIDQLQKYH